jgi:hypothetical protein
MICVVYVIFSSISIDFRHFFYHFYADSRHFLIDSRHFFADSRHFFTIFHHFSSIFVIFSSILVIFSSILVIFSPILVIFSSFSIDFYHFFINFHRFSPIFPLFPPISAYFSAQFPPAPPRNPPWHAADCPKAAIKGARCRAAAAQRGPHAARGGRRFRARGGGGVDGRHRLRGVWVGGKFCTDRCACFWGIYWC